MREGAHPFTRTDEMYHDKHLHDPSFRLTEKEAEVICRGYKLNRFIRAFRLGKTSDRGTLFCQPSV